MVLHLGLWTKTGYRVFETVLEIAEPLGEDGDIYNGLPDSITDERLTVLDAPNLYQMLFLQDTLPKGFMSSMLLNPSSYCSRAFFNPNIGNGGMLDYKSS